jgi:hypothetical protein
MRTSQIGCRRRQGAWKGSLHVELFPSPAGCVIECRSRISESILRRSLRRPFSGFSLRLRTMIVISRISCSCSRDKASALFEETAAMLSARSISSRAAYARLVARKSRRSVASSPASIVTGELSRWFFGRFFFFIDSRWMSASTPLVGWEHYGQRRMDGS